MIFEKKFLDDLYSIPVPETLSPESIENSLKTKKKHKFSRNTFYKTISGIAACIIAVVSISIAYPKGKNDILNSQKSVSSYDVLYTKLDNYYKNQAVINFWDDLFCSDYKYEINARDMLDGVPENSTSSSTNSPSASKEYSTTNTQVDGVDEADIIKTDGQYIYYISDDKLYIVKANDGKPALVSSFDLLKSNNYSSTHTSYSMAYATEKYEMYITDSKLIIVANEELSDANFCSCWRYNGLTNIIVYDISDKNNIRLFSKYRQSGYYNNSRLIDNKLYLITNQYNSSLPESPEDIEEYVPYYIMNDAIGCVSPKDIYIPETIEDTSYSVISSLDVTKSEPLCSIKTVIGCSNEIYCSENAVYLTKTTNYHTNIFKITLGNKLEISAQGKVSGYVINQFAMDEYNGYFRIATTSNEYLNGTSSNVFVLDDKLEIVGQINGIGKTETIQSARFDGNTGYLVTFRQTDPLFKIDLTDPTNPKIVDELKVTGFSTYLHKWANGLLLGIGEEADLNGGVCGIKLSMFSTDSNGGLTEISKVLPLGVYDDSYNFSPALYNHKAILIDSQKNIIGFPASSHNEYSQKEYYLIYSYENGEFVKKAEVSYDNKENYNSDFISFERGLYIGDYIYVASTKGFTVISTDSFEITSSLNLE